MKKIKILIAIASLLITANSFGQGFYTNVSYDMAIPLGNTSDFISKASFRGMTFGLGQHITENIAIDVRVSWATFYKENDFETYTSEDGSTAITGKAYRYINSIPLTAGGRYVINTSNTLSPYFAAGLGAYSINERTDMGIWTKEVHKWHFGFYPEVGLYYNIGYNIDIHAFARYEYAVKTKDTGSYSYLTFGFGLSFRK